MDSDVTVDPRMPAMLALVRLARSVPAVSVGGPPRAAA
jgi:hypothetical protein